MDNTFYCRKKRSFLPESNRKVRAGCKPRSCSGRKNSLQREYHQKIFLILAGDFLIYQLAVLIQRILRIRLLTYIPQESAEHYHFVPNWRELKVSCGIYVSNVSVISSGSILRVGISKILPANQEYLLMILRVAKEFFLPGTWAWLASARTFSIWSSGKRPFFTAIESISIESCTVYLARVLLQFEHLMKKLSTPIRRKRITSSLRFRQERKIKIFWDFEKSEKLNIAGSIDMRLNWFASPKYPALHPVGCCSVVVANVVRPEVPRVTSAGGIVPVWLWCCKKSFIQNKTSQSKDEYDKYYFWFCDIFIQVNFNEANMYWVVTLKSYSEKLPFCDFRFYGECRDIGQDKAQIQDFLRKAIHCCTVLWL